MKFTTSLTVALLFCATAPIMPAAAKSGKSEEACRILALERGFSGHGRKETGAMNGFIRRCMNGAQR